MSLYRSPSAANAAIYRSPSSSAFGAPFGAMSVADLGSLTRLEVRRTREHVERGEHPLGFALSLATWLFTGRFPSAWSVFLGLICCRRRVFSFSYTALCSATVI